jgi:hypothetical protein
MIENKDDARPVRDDICVDRFDPAEEEPKRYTEDREDETKRDRAGTIED